MSRVVLIGGAGFIGSNIQKLLPNSVVLDLTSTGEYYVDIRDASTLYDKLRPSDIVVLLAAVHRDDIINSKDYYDTNVTGTSNVLKIMEDVGCKKLIFFSSVAVYGSSVCALTEDSPCNPMNHYGKSKLEAENKIKYSFEAGYLKNVVIVRPTVVFGKGNKGNVFNLYRSIKKHKFVMIGAGTSVKSMAYVENVAAFIEYLLKSMSLGYNVYNYSDSPDLTTNELVQILRNNLGHRYPLIRIPMSLRLLSWIQTLANSAAFNSVLVMRIIKFNSNSIISSDKIETKTEFIRPMTLKEGLTITFERLPE